MIMKIVFWTFLLFTSLGVLHSQETEKHCTASNVDIFPKNRTIYLLGNSTLDVECRINDTNLCRSKDITFWDREKKVDDRYVEANESTVRLRIPLEENVYHFICKHNEDGLHTFMVRVGHPPEEVNFTCVSKDYEELSCSFPEVSNPAVPNYSVKYSVATRVPSASVNLTETKNNSQYSKCSLARTSSGRHCNISIFRKFWNYLFEITIANQFGERTQVVNIDPRKIAIPNRPEIKNTTNITSRSANLTWQLSTNFNTYDLPFIHRVSVKSKYADFEDHDLSELITNRVDGRHVFSILLNLPYAYTWYDVRVYTRVKEALYGDALWSNFSSTAFQTLPRTPDNPPKIDVGGFQKIDNELKIFWKELADSERNGANLTYEVVEVLENDVIKHTRKPKEPITKSMARFSDTRPDIKYTFKIISKNAQGRSLNTSVIVVPRQSDRFKFPFNLKKVLYNRQYTLTWDPPNDQFDLIQDYTIFWCDPQDEQTQLCDTEFDFKRINRSETSFTYANVIEKQKIFAISANTNHSSSGMIWFPCSATNNSDMTKVTSPVMEVISFSSVNVSWGTSCDTTPLVQGFNVSYCVIGSDVDSGCSSEEKHLYVEKKTPYVRIDNLLAHTTYRVNISMFNGKYSGPAQDVQNVTKSTKPTPPHNLRVKRKYATKLLLHWDPPKLWNGFPQKYIIEYYDSHSDTSKKAVIDRGENGLQTEYELTDLKGYTHYDIKMKACNVECSGDSNKITPRTLIGKPSAVVDLKETDLTEEKFEWKAPEIRAGHINFYEFRAEVHRNKKTYDRIRVLRTTQCVLRTKTCQNDQPKDVYTFYVRAVNVAPRTEIPDYALPQNKTSPYGGLGIMDDSLENNQICYEDVDDAEIKMTHDECNINGYCFYGPWQKTSEVRCKSNTIKSMPILTIFFGFIFFVFIIYGLIQSVKKFKKMKDIGIVIPPGLEDISKSPESAKSKITNDDSFMNEDERLIGAIQKSSSTISFENKGGRTSEFSESDNENHLSDEQISNPEYEPIDQNSPILYINGRSDHNQLINSPHQSTVQQAHFKNPNSPGDGKIIPVPVDQPMKIPGGSGHLHQQPPAQPVNQIMSNNYVSPNIFLKPKPTPVSSVGVSNYVTHDAMKQMAPIPSSGYTPFSAVMNANKIEPKIEQKTPIVTSTNGISGYVTHKQLSDFHNTLMQ